ncbi:hypothetical protein AKO1_013562 [Acrasis kona]|uniref:Uncharacterized protein n=1 Tax=Acrasis kona TaxID=1008807 RepID=A0AAW2ZJS2_9EUKA
MLGSKLLLNRINIDDRLIDYDHDVVKQLEDEKILLVIVADVKNVEDRRRITLVCNVDVVDRKNLYIIYSASSPSNAESSTLLCVKSVKNFLLHQDQSRLSIHRCLLTHFTNDKNSVPYIKHPFLPFAITEPLQNNK